MGVGPIYAAGTAPKKKEATALPTACRGRESAIARIQWCAAPFCFFFSVHERQSAPSALFLGDGHFSPATSRSTARSDAVPSRAPCPGRFFFAFARMASFLALHSATLSTRIHFSSVLFLQRDRPVGRFSVSLLSLLRAGARSGRSRLFAPSRKTNPRFPSVDLFLPLPLTSRLLRRPNSPQSLSSRSRRSFSYGRRGTLYVFEYTRGGILADGGPRHRREKDEKEKKVEEKEHEPRTATLVL